MTFWGLVDHMFKNPRMPMEDALMGVFTAPQLARLKRSLKVRRNLPVAALTEQQWGVIYETMVKYVPSFRWPRMKKGKFNEG